MKLYLKNIVKYTSTNDSGLELYALLKNCIQNNELMTISLKECTPISSSFFNSSFGLIIEEYGWDKLRQHIKVIEASKFQAEIMTLYINSAKKRVGLL